MMPDSITVISANYCEVQQSAFVKEKSIQAEQAIPGREHGDMEIGLLLNCKLQT